MSHECEFLGPFISSKYQYPGFIVLIKGSLYRALVTVPLTLRETAFYTRSEEVYLDAHSLPHFGLSSWTLKSFILCSKLIYHLEARNTLWMMKLNSSNHEKQLWSLFSMRQVIFCKFSFTLVIKLFLDERPQTFVISTTVFLDHL